MEAQDFTEILNVEFLSLICHLSVYAMEEKEIREVICLPSSNIHQECIWALKVGWTVSGEAGVRPL